MMRAIIIGFLVFTGNFQTFAHPNLLDKMWVRFEPASVHVSIDVSLREISVAESVPLEENGFTDPRLAMRGAERHREYLLRHLFLDAGTNRLVGTVVQLIKPGPQTAPPEQTFYQYEIQYPVHGQLPAEVRFYHEMLKEWPYSVGTTWEVSYVLQLVGMDGNNLSTWLLRRQQPLSLSTGYDRDLQPVPVSVASGRWRTFVDYLHHGIWHILTGYDHLLFVSALVLVTTRFWEMFKVIAAFTAAHTLTLVLSILNIVRLPSSFVEPVIALSIVVVAIENILRPDAVHSRARLSVAFGFGLVHGLGFAGGLLDAMAGLPSIGIWIALAAFSLGVEIGHQAVVLPLFGLLTWVGRDRRATARQSFTRYGSLAILIGGLYFLFVAFRIRFSNQ